MIIKINVKKKFKPLGGRDSARDARETIKSILLENNSLELDFSGVILTPTFAYEVISKLVKEIGINTFRNKIKLINVSSGSKAIIKCVLNKDKE